jgi:hypothetical protein
MVKSELIEKSPLRKLEAAIGGGVGNGNLAVIASKKGIGKTACLVHIATDKLMNDRHVIHVSYANRVDHIISWYEDIFKEIARRKKLEKAMETHDELIRNRVIMNFNQRGIGVDKVLASVSAMIDQGHFKTDAVIVDGYDFTIGHHEDIKKFKDFAAKANIELWFSDSYPEDNDYTDNQGIPKNLTPYLDLISVVVTLKATADGMVLKLIKDHDKIVTEDLSLILDAKTLLISDGN